MSEIANFMEYFALASFMALFSAMCLTATVLILKPLLADFWRDFWRERS